MDYIDWCMQAYITTITPITYGTQFKNLIETILDFMVTFESLEALNTFIQEAVIYYGTGWVRAQYTLIVIVRMHSYASALYEFLNKETYTKSLAKAVE